MSQVSISDFIRARFVYSIIIEIFESYEGILIIGSKHLFECFFFDWKWCNHYMKKTHFTIMYGSVHVSKCCKCYKLSLMTIPDNFLHIFC